MNVSLTPEPEMFVASKVVTGRYQTASEVVCEGLRLLEERDAKPGFVVSSEEELHQKIREGIQSLDRGQGISGTEAAAKLCNRAAAWRKTND